MKRSTAIVATTIFDPEFLSGYERNIEAAGRRDETSLYIIPDRKTPETVFSAARQSRLRVVCPTLQEQDEFLNKLRAPADFIPYNSDNRRNIGFLMALDAGCDVLISIDDDNFCPPDGDFVGQHNIVGSCATDLCPQSSDKWFNICTLLDGPDVSTAFPRGYPYHSQQVTRKITSEQTVQPIPIAMNAGLWLDEPDVDAITRLNRHPKVRRFVGPNIILDAQTWSPINTQNTALTREAALTYYYVRMGFPLRGLSIDRFGDILSGYLTQKVIKHLKQGIRVGTPIVDHRRTPHNLFKDLYHELAGIVLIEDFVPWLMDARLDGTTFMDAYASLAEAIAQAAERFRGFIWDDGGRLFLQEMAQHMQIWLKIVRQIEGTR